MEGRMGKLAGLVLAGRAELGLGAGQTGQAGGAASVQAAPPGMTAAQGAAYCSKLSQTYGEYVGTFGGYLGGDSRGGEAADLDARVAIAHCQDGKYAAGIPVLQEKRRDAGVPAPPPPAG